MFGLLRTQITQDN